MPQEWQYTVAADKQKQFNILKELMCRKDVESLVCAADAGREGELIFRFVYQMEGCTKPFIIDNVHLIIAYIQRTYFTP